MREFEERFINLGLPYKVIGGPRFYERLEIRDALAYLRCVAQPADDLAFERIVNTPKRGLGESTLQIVHDYARRSQIPLMQAARALVETEELKNRPRTSLRSLLTDFSRWSGLVEHKPHYELAEQILEESGYTDFWKQDRSAEAEGRLENLKELVRSIEEFPDLGAFLEHVSLVMDADNKEGGERVSIMTLHGAKGLEFETVFLPGWEEGLFPHQRSLDESGRAGLEEERRLAYVGITRARQAGEDHVRQQPPHPRPVADHGSLALHRRFAACSCATGRKPAKRRPLRRLCAVALRQYGLLRLALRHARLEAGAAARGRAPCPGAADHRGRSGRALHDRR